MDKKRFPIFQVLTFTMGAYALNAYARGWGEPAQFVVPFASMFLVFILVFSLCAYKFPYSVIGTKRRWPPDGSLPRERSFSSFHCGKWYFKVNTFALVSLHDEGIFVRAFFTGSGFLRFDEIERLEKRFGGYRIFHRSPAFHSPLQLSLSKTVLAALEQVDVSVQSATKESKRHIYLIFALHWGLSYKRRMLQYIDPEILRVVRTEREQELRYGGKTLTDGREGYLSPNGKLLAYRSNRETFILRDIQSAKPPLVTVQAAPADIDWTSDGEFVLVAFRANEQRKFKMIDSSGKIHQSLYGKWAGLGPQLGQVTVLSQEGEDSRFDVYSLMDGTLEKKLPAPDMRRFAWHPSGDQFLLLKSDGLYLSNADLKEQKQLLETTQDLNFHWSRLGAHFVVLGPWQSSAIFRRDGSEVEDFGLKKELKKAN